MKPGDLTTLGRTKAWLITSGYAGGTSDDVLSQLISRWSGAILAELERPWILPKIYANDAYDGDGGDHQFVRNWPVTNVIQVAVGGRIIPPSPIIPGQFTGNNFGYRFEEWDGIPPGGPQGIELVGSRYYRGKLNVQISYEAGYLVSGEAQTVPSGSANPSIIVNQPYGIWAQDNGVTYSNGTSLVAVPYDSGALPGIAGEYTVLPPDTAQTGGLSDPGQYIFSSSDANRGILISYGFIPAALEQIAIELSLERFMYRTRIGELSRTVQQQITTKFDSSEFPKYAIPVLQRYRSILPL